MHNYEPSENRYSSMQYNRCGKSGLLLPKLSLGLWHNFGEVDSESNFKKIIFRSFDLGITHFDLANNYGPPPGSAEENFGKILKNHLSNYRDELIISTKAGYYMWQGPYGDWGSRKYLMASLNQSLRRMNVEYVDIFYHHRPDPLTPLEETMKALADIVAQGKALYVGLSNYKPEQTIQAVKLLKQMGTPCLIHQAKYSMFERWVEPQLLEMLDQEGVGCIAFSPLAQGLLTDKYLKGIAADSRAGKSQTFLKPEAITKEKLAAIGQLNIIAKERGQTLAQMALQWVMRNKEMTSVLIGASKPEQVQDAVQFMNGKDFDSDELKQIDSILNF